MGEIERLASWYDNQQDLQRSLASMRYLKCYGLSPEVRERAEVSIFNLRRVAEYKGWKLD